MFIPDSIAKYIGKSLMIYELPVEGVRYYGGVDTASGSGGDYSTISILNADGEQVLSFTTIKFLFMNLLSYLISLGSFIIMLFNSRKKLFWYANLRTFKKRI